jgi:hypothetical protein
MGDSLVWEVGQVVAIAVEGLAKDDVLRVVTQDDIIDLYQAPSLGSCQFTHPVSGPGFLRIEIWRTFLPGIPPLPALLSNPIYFDKG